ncbi:MAG: hypothetical protein AAF399_20555 [Bacteroidota bacterium]
MSKHIVAVLCEGPHDTAFLNKILKTDGYKQAENVSLGSYPSPMSGLLIQQAKEADVANLNLQEVRRQLLPMHVLEKENVFLFLFSLGGDKKPEPREYLLSKFRQFSLSTINPKRIRVDKTGDANRYSLLYFWDADEKGTSARIDAINREIDKALGITDKLQLHDSGDIQSVDGLQLGCYVFTEKGTNKGKLESILLPLMQKENEAIFESAEDFLTQYHSAQRLKKLKIQVQDDGSVIEKRKNHHKFDFQKSLIGTVGQLQLSGSSNTVCINHSDYLTLGKIGSDPSCQEIIHFFRNATA